MIIALLRVFAGATGILLIIAGAFSTEVREREIQHTLEAWWVRLDDTAAKATRSHVRLLRSASRRLLAYLDSVFGTSLRSLHFAAAGASLTVTTIALMNAEVASSDWRCGADCGREANAWLWLAAAALVTGIAAARWRPFRPVALLLLPVGVFIADRQQTYEPTPVPLLLLGIVGGTLCTAGIFHLVRRSLTAIVHAESGWRLLIETAALVLTGPLLFVLLFYLLIATADTALGSAVGFMLAAILIDLLIAFAFTAVVATLLVHRLAWAVLGAPLYSVQRHSLLEKHRGKVCLAGFVILALSFPQTRSILEPLEPFLK